MQAAAGPHRCEVDFIIHHRYRHQPSGAGDCSQGSGGEQGLTMNAGVQQQHCGSPNQAVEATARSPQEHAQHAHRRAEEEKRRAEEASREAEKQTRVSTAALTVVGERLQRHPDAVCRPGLQSGVPSGALAHEGVQLQLLFRVAILARVFECQGDIGICVRGEGPGLRDRCNAGQGRVSHTRWQPYDASTSTRSVH